MTQVTKHLPPKLDTRSLPSALERRCSRRAVSVGVLSALLPAWTYAQQRPKVIGILNPYASQDTEAAVRTFERTLTELGYTRGQHFITVERAANGRTERLGVLAEELVSLNVDLILVSSTVATTAALRATSTTPIVFITVSDPVRSGFADSLAKPGRSLTGLSNFSRDLDSKRLELLSRMAPQSKLVAVLIHPATAQPTALIKQLGPAAQALGMQLQFFSAQTDAEIDRAFEEMLHQRAQAVLSMPDPLFWVARKKIAALAIKARLPSMYGFASYAVAGGLMSYGPDELEPPMRAATLVDKIFRGAKPGELPIEQPVRVALAINRRTASELGVTIPQQLLLQAELII
jgi:putative tryptophan/tyrosine transport system substrate-binding protein